MNYKRLEIYVGWTCNQRCTYCMEYSNMERKWYNKITKYDILKKLIKYRKFGYNHVTLLGGEPFIQPIFFDALKIAKKLRYTILVTTNCTTLHIASQAEKYLFYIDELIISFEAVDKCLQQKISRSRNFVQWDKVFYNIDKYWKGNLLKANIVITQDNKNNLFELVKFLSAKGVNNVAITYPDLDLEYYGKEHIMLNVAPRYSECINNIIKIVKFCVNNKIRIKLVDFPFCIFPKNEIEDYLKLTDDYDYDNRVKVDDILYENENIFFGEINRMTITPRARQKGTNCKNCFYNTNCWGYSKFYELLYSLNEINAIDNKL